MKANPRISSIKMACSYWAIRFIAVWRAPKAHSLRSLRSSSLRLSLYGFLLAALVVAGGGNALALPLGDESEATVETKQMVGEVSVVRPHYLSIVVYPDGKTDTEMVLLLEDDVELSFIDSLEELNTGDRISVTVEERTWQVEGYDLVRTKRVATAIKFLRPAVTGMRSEE